MARPKPVPRAPWTGSCPPGKTARKSCPAPRVQCRCPYRIRGCRAPASRSPPPARRRTRAPRFRPVGCTEWRCSPSCTPTRRSNAERPSPWRARTPAQSHLGTRRDLLQALHDALRVRGTSMGSRAPNVAAAASPSERSASSRLDRVRMSFTSDVRRPASL